MVADEGQAVAVVDEERVGGAVARPGHDAKLAPAGTDAIAVAQADVGVARHRTTGG